MRSKSWLVRWAQWLLGPPFSCDVFCEVAYGARVSRSTPRRSRLYLPSCCPVEVDLERCQTPVRHQGQRCRVVRPSLVAGTSSENQRSRGPGTRVFSDSGTAFVIVVRRCAATKLIRGARGADGCETRPVLRQPPVWSSFERLRADPGRAPHRCSSTFAGGASRNASRTRLRPAQEATFAERGTWLRRRLSVRDVAGERWTRER